MIIKFEELRRVKDSLPHGSMQKIADKLGIEEQTVKNYFGAYHFENGGFVDFHLEAGAEGGYVKLDDPEIYEAALRILENNTSNAPLS